MLARNSCKQGERYTFRTLLVGGTCPQAPLSRAKLCGYEECLRIFRLDLRPKQEKALCLIALLWRLMGIGLSSIAPQIWDCGADRVRKVQRGRADRSRIPHRIRGYRGWF